MSRRRPTLAAFLRRRWRVVGAVVVLLLGSLLVLGITDRGHDPVWRAQSASFDQIDVAPDGSAVYALVREGDNISRLEARRGADGALLWESPVNASRALLRATPQGVVVATDFPLAFVTYYDHAGGVRAAFPLQGNPRAMAVDGARFALALQAPTNPILLFQEGVLVDSLEMPSFVSALDYESGRVAAGTGAGQVTVFAADGSIVYNASHPVNVRSLRLAADGSAVAVGGSSIEPGNLSGVVAFIDLASSPAAEWTATTSGGVGLISMDTRGLWVLAVEDAPPRARLSLFEGGTSRLLWTREFGASVARDDAGAFGGAALSGDGRYVGASTLRGETLLLDGQSGATRWTYRGGGSTIITFPQDDASLLLTNGRLLPSRSYESLFAFAPGSEPVGDRALLVAAGLVGAAALTLVLVIGVGYWRARRA